MKRKLPPLNAVVAFEAAARNESFRKAGEELCVTSSAISHQVRALEEWLGVKLFERSARAVELTDLGTRYSRELGGLLGKLEKISDLDPGRRKGKKVVTIQTTDSFASRWLLPRLPEFEALHPDVTIRIVTRDFRTGLRSADADLGILFLNADQVTAAAAGEDTMTLLFAETIFPVCNPELVRGLKSMRVADLQNFTLIHDDNQGTSWPDWIAAVGEGDSAAARQAKDGTHYNRSHLALAAAEFGNGFALASSILSSDALKEGRLVAPFKEKVETGCGYCLAQSQKARQRKECRVFCEWIIGQSR